MIDKIRALREIGMGYLMLFHPLIARMFESLAKNQAGNIITTVIMLVLAILVVGTVIPAMWPIAVDSLANVAAMNGTDTGTVLIKALWPIGVMVAAIGLGIWLIIFAIKKLGITGGGGGKKGTGW